MKATVQKVLKVNIYKILRKPIASLAVVLACSSSFAEIIEGENPDSIYSCAYEKLSGQSSQAKRTAKEKAEISAMQEFVQYAVKENLRLHKSLEHLSSKIKNSIILYSSKGKIKGAKAIRSLILNDGRAVCVLEIPRSNLSNFKSLDLRANPQAILDFIAEPRLLKLEIALVLNTKNPFDALIQSSPLARAMQEKSLNGIPQAWVKDIDSVENISALNDNQLLILVEDSLGEANLQKTLLAQVEKRGYPKSSEALKGYSIPTKQASPECEAFLESIKLDESFAKLSRVIAKNKCVIDFANVDIENEYLELAQGEFAKENVDFDKTKTLLVESLLDNVCDDAMNLLGRCYEEEGKIEEALIYYFQTLSINPEQAYVKMNLANCFYALNDKDNALYWANSTLDDDSSSAWSKGKAQELITKIEGL